MVNRRVVGATGLVVAGILAAAVAGQLPALGAADHALVERPPSPRQTLVCPGPAVAIGASAAAADALSAIGRPARTAGTARGSAVTSTPIGRGDVDGGATPRLLTSAAEPTAGDLAGAQAETVTGGDAAGLAATDCTAPSTDSWFAAGATTTGRTSVLLLANPSSADARVSVDVWTEDGPVDAGTSGRVTVPAGSRSAVSLSGIAPTAGGLVVHVVSEGPRVGAALEQRTVRGLESGGVDITGPTTAPAGRQTVVGVRIAQASAVAAAAREDDYADLLPVVRVMLPGRTSADVAITVAPAGGGSPVHLGRRVAAGVVTDFAVPNLPDGEYTVTVAAARPLVTGVRTSTVANASGSSGTTSATATKKSGSEPPGTDAGLVGGDGPVGASSTPAAASSGAATSSARGIDLAWFAAAPTLGPSAAVAVPDVPSTVLAVANPGRTRTVTLGGAANGTLTIPGGSTGSVAVPAGVVVLTGTDGMTAGVSAAGDDAVAGFPVRPGGQEARAVRISP